jgi:hypothetical protein
VDSIADGVLSTKPASLINSPVLNVDLHSLISIPSHLAFVEDYIYGTTQIPDDVEESEDLALFLFDLLDRGLISPLCIPYFYTYYEEGAFEHFYDRYKYLFKLDDDGDFVLIGSRDDPLVVY